MRHSLVVIVPADQWDTYRAMAQAMGYEPGAGVPLSANGISPETHRGLHDAASSSRVALMTGTVAPVDLPGHTAAEIADAISQCIVSADPATGERNAEHFARVLEAQGLAVVDFDAG
ncbi:hypothetical protein [Roseibium sp. RKSG952]|uniref:hypothetical protein n=1 Tax=Roseibium sp. RKSG952 TaxID=2529384 RepID=UPI0012BC689D|nr:hypothetical protein [Roseibium sp. RKSG952]MTH94631.1 hypothetical protein [Roseibium sp. RKSG952]